MVKVELEEVIREGKIITVAKVYAEKTILERVRHYVKEYSEIYDRLEQDCLYLKCISDTDVRLYEVKDTIVDMVKQAIEDVKNLEKIEIILDI